MHGLPQKMMDWYCWTHGTWTVKELTVDRLRHEVAHPGVGLYDEEIHTLIHHTYYQWVPLVMAITAIAFYVPRFLWKITEGGFMQAVCKEKRFEDPEEKITRAKCLRQYFLNSKRRNRKYTFNFVFCEVLNLFNVVAQWFATNSFLNGAFYLYGHEIFHYFEKTSPWRLQTPSEGEDEHIDPTEAVFPKVTACTFNKHGPSGDIQRIHGLCVLPLNVLNEKIYYLLWFWYVALFAATLFWLVYRVLSIVSSAVRR